MAEKKRKEIFQSYYYDGRRKVWLEDHFQKPCTPTKKEVCSWIKKWENTYGYPEQESALDKLFIELCPENKNLDDILIKVCTLNDFYSTNIYKVFEIAKIILDLDVDKRLNSDIPDAKLVDEIVALTKEKTGRSIYSFASKYCSHHRPELYPIYDSYVDILLRYYRDHEKSMDFSFDDSELKKYSSFCDIERKFKTHFGLEDFNAKEIDKFLWQEGKKCFPRWEETNE